MDKGAPLEGRDGSDNTPLLAAGAKPHVEIVKVPMMHSSSTSNIQSNNLPLILLYFYLYTSSHQSNDLLELVQRSLDRVLACLRVFLACACLVSKPPLSHSLTEVTHLTSVEWKSSSSTAFVLRVLLVFMYVCVACVRQALLARGADGAACDAEGYTALTMAAQGGAVAALEVCVWCICVCVCVLMCIAAHVPLGRVWMCGMRRCIPARCSLVCVCVCGHCRRCLRVEWV